MKLAADIFEALTAILFGIYWPILIVQTWRSGRIQGPPMPIMTVFLGAYACSVLSVYLRAAATGQPVGWPIIFYWIDVVAVTVAYGLFVYLKIAGEKEPE